MESGFGGTIEETPTDLSIRKLRATISKIEEHSIIKVIRLGERVFEDINGTVDFTKEQLSGIYPTTFMSHEIAKSILLEENEYEIVISDELPKKGIHLDKVADVKVSAMSIDSKPFTFTGTGTMTLKREQFKLGKQE